MGRWKILILGLVLVLFGGMAYGAEGGELYPISGQQIPVLGTGVTYFAVPAETQIAMIQVTRGGPVRINFSHAGEGTAPTTTTGVVMFIYDTYVCEGYTEARAFRAISDSSSSGASMQAIYFGRVGGR